MWPPRRQRHHRLPVRATIASRRHKRSSSSRQGLIPLLLTGCGCVLLLVCMLAVVVYQSTTPPQHLSSSLFSFDVGLGKANNITVEHQNNWPWIHIVNTRFMQEQGNLTTLAMARLHLFETFCLPTMIHQTTQSFLWIIKTDPNLDATIRQQLVSLLEPHPNFYLVGSNVNFQTNHGEGSWRDGSEGRNVLESPIYTGNIQWLYEAHELRHERMILETRLDADDGLHKVYLQYVQYSALKYLSGYKWLYWCSRRHIEWYPSPHKKEGMINPVEHEKLCITPGITVGFPVGSQQVPQFGHDVLYKAIQASGGCHFDENRGKVDNEDCIQLVDDLSFVAVRSRTATSAGMMDTQLEREFPNKKSVKTIWTIMDKLFFISQERAKETNSYLQTNIQTIAKENLEGQCTPGHSCKNSSAVLLKKLMQTSL